MVGTFDAPLAIPTWKRPFDGHTVPFLHFRHLGSDLVDGAGPFMAHNERVVVRRHVAADPAFVPEVDVAPTHAHIGHAQDHFRWVAYRWNRVIPDLSIVRMVEENRRILHDICRLMKVCR